MTALTAFDFEDTPVRVFEREGGTIWFVAADVCRALDIKNSRDAVARLDDDERDDVGLTDAIGRDQRTTIISEGGLYTLVLRSRQATTPGTLPHRFRKWVTAEVLPAIRKTGRYDPALPAEARAYQEWSIEEMRAKVALVTMYRRSYGNKASRWMAAELGFPRPPAHTRRQHLAYDPELGCEVLVREDEEDEL